MAPEGGSGVQVVREGGGEVLLEGGATGNCLSALSLLKKTCMMVEVAKGGDRGGSIEEEEGRAAEGKGKEKEKAEPEMGATPGVVGRDARDEGGDGRNEGVRQGTP